MAAKAVVIPETPAEPEAGSDIFLIAMPLATYRALSDTAAIRNMTFAQAMQQALNQWIEAVPTLPSSVPTAPIQK
jgi:hypothetical protein